MVKKKEDTGTIPPAASSQAGGGPSILNIFLLYATLVGFGAISGYGVFYSIFSNRCSDLVDDVERRHNQTHREMEDKYMGALEEQHKCIENESRKQEIAELKGRLDGQSSLVIKHQGLLDKHQNTVEKLTSMHSSHNEAVRKYEDSQRTSSSKEEEIVSLKRELEESKQVLERVERRQANKLELSNKMVKKKIEENNKLKKERDECFAAQKMSALDVEQMKSQIQSRQDAQCKERNGNGPYHVQFVVQLPGEDSTEQFVVEVGARREMPHSVATFLTMVHENLFLGMAFSSSSDGVVRLSASSGKNQEVSARFRSAGFGNSALFFTEALKSASCEKGSLGFSGLGPGLQIYTADRADENECMGKIMRGTNVVDKLDEALANGHMVDVVEVTYIYILSEETDHSEL